MDSPIAIQSCWLDLELLVHGGTTSVSQGPLLRRNYVNGVDAPWMDV